MTVAIVREIRIIDITRIRIIAIKGINPYQTKWSESVIIQYQEEYKMSSIGLSGTSLAIAE